MSTTRRNEARTEQHMPATTAPPAPQAQQAKRLRAVVVNRPQPQSPPVEETPEAKHQRLKARVNYELLTLSCREREIIKLRYGLDDGKVYTRKRVGRIFRINKEEARQIEEKALGKLKHQVRQRRLEEFCHILATDGPSEPEGYAHLMEDLFDTHARHGGPNLFKWASGELSQDAFFCWLLAWAQRREKYEDAAKHQTGVFFLNSLLALHQMQAPEEYGRVEIRRQFRGIDILILIHNDLALLIEDKTASSEGDGQLRGTSKLSVKPIPDESQCPSISRLETSRVYRACWMLAGGTSSGATY